MKIGEMNDFLLGVSFERKIKHWKKMANNGYLPRRCKFPRVARSFVKG